MTRHLDILTKHLYGQAEAAAAGLAKWQAAFAKNPLNALEWSSQAYLDAARQEIALRFTDIVAYGECKGFSDVAILAEVKKDATRELLRLSTQATSKSTSQGANAVEEARLQAVAQLVKYLESL